MIHNFVLVSASDNSPADYSRFIGAPDAIRVHDDFLNYIVDSLQWIPTLNPSTNGRGYG